MEKMEAISGVLESIGRSVQPLSRKEQRFMEELTHSTYKFYDLIDVSNVNDMESLKDCVLKTHDLLQEESNRIADKYSIPRDVMLQTYAVNFNTLSVLKAQKQAPDEEELIESTKKTPFIRFRFLQNIELSTIKEYL